jgi:hypothetical protein
MMFNEPIITIEQAKEYFRAMECSSYHMWREYPQRFDEYKQLNISKETEKKWQEERYEEYYIIIKENTDSSSLWDIHSRMYDLFEVLKTESTLNKMLEITQYIHDRVPMADRVKVAETINGRKMRQFRSGLIYSAYDLDNIVAAKEFVELSLHFSVYDGQDRFGIERSKRAFQLCNEIKLELGLS